MGRQWEGNGKAMGRQWEGNGKAMGRQWEGNGKGLVECLAPSKGTTGATQDQSTLEISHVWKKFCGLKLPIYQLTVNYILDASVNAG